MGTAVGVCVVGIAVGESVGIDVGESDGIAVGAVSDKAGVGTSVSASWRLYNSKILSI